MRLNAGCIDRPLGESCRGRVCIDGGAKGEERAFSGGGSQMQQRAAECSSKGSAVVLAACAEERGSREGAPDAEMKVEREAKVEVEKATAAPSRA